jgi:cell wall assembly regulator SMI1
MDELFEQLEQALKRFAPSVYARLGSPASEHDIANAENALGLKLPDDVKAAYRWHNGCRSEPEWFIGSCWWANLQEMVERWQMMVRFSTQDRERNPGNYPPYTLAWDSLNVKPVWWSPKWIPIGRSITSTAFYIDLDPAPAGQQGQILFDVGMQDASVVAPSFGSYLRELARLFEEGRLIEAPDRSWGEMAPGRPVVWSSFDWQR